MHDFGQALGIGDNDAFALAADFLMRAEGVPPLVGAEIPPTNRYGHNPWLMDFLKAQTILRAHYCAGLEKSDWRTEHAKIYPGISDGTRDNWNALVSNPERQDCRRVGDLVRCKAPLTPKDAQIQLRATRYEASALRERIHGKPD